MYGMPFGVELELDGLRPAELARALERFGVRVRRPGFGNLSVEMMTPKGPYHFDIKLDGSVPEGSEICTGILNEFDLHFLQRLLNYLEGCDMKTGPKCGLHVHVGLPADMHSLRDTSVRPVRFDRVKSMRFKETIQANWRTVLPTVSRSYQPKPSRLRFCKMDPSDYDFKTERYCAMNLTQSRHNTVEFRLFDAHISYRWMCRAIRLSCGLVKLSLDGKRLSPCNPGQSVESVIRDSLAESPQRA